MSYEDFKKALEKKVADGRLTCDTVVGQSFNSGMETVACYAKTVFLELQMNENNGKGDDA